MENRARIEAQHRKSGIQLEILQRNLSSIKFCQFIKSRIFHGNRESTTHLLTKHRHMTCQLCKMAMGPNPENFRSAVPGLSGKNLEVPVPEQSCSTKIPFLQLREAGVPRITINKEPNSLRTWQPYPGFIQILHAQPCATALWFPTGIQDNTSSQQPGQLFPSCSGEHR